MSESELNPVEVLDVLASEIQANIAAYNERCKLNSMSTEELIALRLQQNAELADLLRQQRRALRFMAGEKIEPETHFGEAIVIGTFGGGL